MKWLVLLAGLFTLLNCAKPLVVDDTVYHYYAVHIAEHPGDPYGFTLPWGEPANTILAPPVLLYWWAGAMRLFGDQLFLCKLSLLPFSLLFIFSLHALCRRFARQLAMPLVWMLVLSPVFLPSLNMMLDVPALALGCCALSVFFRGSDRGSLAWALAAGFIAAIAMETKYTAFVVPGVMVLHAVLFRRLRLGLAAALVAVALFVTWEAFTAQAYGESHFLHALADRRLPLAEKLKLGLPLLGQMGGTAPAVLLLGLIALGRSRRMVWCAAGLIAGGFLLLAAVPESWAILLRDARTHKASLSVNNLVFGTLGLALFATGAAVMWRLCLPPRSMLSAGGRWRGRRVDTFLALWLGLEVVAYFVLSPFPAVRRVMGIFVVGTLLTGRLAARTCRRARPQRGTVWQATGVSIALGLLYFAVDFREYAALRSIVQTAARDIRVRDPEATIWYSGNHGTFEHYAALAGMKRFAAAGPARPSGWAIVPDQRVHASDPLIQYCLDEGATVMARLKVDALVPLRTWMCYYFGNTALEHRDGPLVEATLYRIGH
jgi:hypothetical protein